MIFVLVCVGVGGWGTRVLIDCYKLLIEINSEIHLNAYILVSFFHV